MVAARLLLLLCVPVISACSGDSLSACEAHVVASCDIHEQGCQDDHSALLGCLRAEQHPAPPIEFLIPQEYVEQYLGGEPPDADVLLLRGLSLLDLSLYPGAPPEPISYGIPAAFFDEDRGKVIVIDETDERAHLQAIASAHVDAGIGGLAGYTGEQETSVDLIDALAVYTGEGVFYGDAAYFKTEALADADFAEHLRLNLYYDDALLDAVAVARSPDYELGALGGVFAATFGPRLLRNVWLQGGAAGVAALHDGAPPSGHELMRGELDPGHAAPIEGPPPALPDGLEVVLADSFGPWLMHAFQVRADPPPEGTTLQEDLAAALAIGETWRGDRIFFIRDTASDELAILWQIAVGDEPLVFNVPDAHEGAWSWQASAGRLDIVGADTEATRDLVLAALANAGAPAPSGRAPRLPARLLRGSPRS